MKICEPAVGPATSSRFSAGLFGGRPKDSSSLLRQHLQRTGGIVLRGLDGIGEPLRDSDQVLDADVDDRDRVVEEAQCLEIVQEIHQRREAGEDAVEVEIEVAEQVEFVEALGCDREVRRRRGAAEHVVRHVQLQLDPRRVQRIAADVDAQVGQ